MSLHIQDLELQREDGAPLLGPLSLRLASGLRLGLAGGSGSGKSLLVRALFGVLPTGVQQVPGGRVVAWGGPLDGSRARLGWVPQDPLQALNPLLRVEELLGLLPRVHRGEPQATALLRLGPLLERLRLPRNPAFLRRLPHELSGGQRQRLCLAMALSCDPDLLILDEPTTALDPLVQAEFIALVLELHQVRPFDWLWISHDLGVLAATCTHLAVLYSGRIVEEGPIATLLSAPSHPHTVHLLAAARRCEPSLEKSPLA